MTIEIIPFWDKSKRKTSFNRWDEAFNEAKRIEAKGGPAKTKEIKILGHPIYRSYHTYELKEEQEKG
jgi:hypothetical protein